MGIFQSIFGKDKKLPEMCIPATWNEVQPLIMPVLSSLEGLEDLQRALGKMNQLNVSSDTSLPVTDRLDFFMTYVIDLGNTMMTVTNHQIKEWGGDFDQHLSDLPKIAYQNLITHINSHKEIKLEGMEGSIAFINTTPAPEDEYVASIAAFPGLMSQYLEQLGIPEAYIAFPNRYSIALSKPNEAMKTLLEIAIAQFYPTTNARKRISRSIYRFTVGNNDLEIIDTLTDERMGELSAVCDK